MSDSKFPEHATRTIKGREATMDGVPHSGHGKSCSLPQPPQASPISPTSNEGQKRLEK